MNSKRRQLPLEVSSWMDKDLTLKKITANSCIITNDTRQNIVLSRQFFSNMLTLSFARYRKIAEHDFHKRLFLRDQLSKSETAMPGLRPHIEQLQFGGMNRVTSSRIQFSRQEGNTLMHPSVISFLSRPGTRSDPTFNRRQPSPSRQIKTVLPVRSQPDINPTTPSIQRPSTRQQMSRDRLNRLALPKGFRPNSPNEHVRSTTNGPTVTTAEDLFGTIEHSSEILAAAMNTPEKPKSAADDKRFHHLVGVFSKVHTPHASSLQTVQSIVQANPSLQDGEGQWKMTNATTESRKLKLRYRRQMLADQLQNKLDVFLIDVGA